MKIKLTSLACILLALSAVANATTSNKALQQPPNPILLKMSQWHFPAFESELGHYYLDKKEYQHGLTWLQRSQDDGLKKSYIAYDIGLAEFNIGWNYFKKDNYLQAIDYFKQSKATDYDKQDSLYNIKSSYYNLELYYQNHNNTRKENYYKRLYRHCTTEYNRLYNPKTKTNTSNNT